MYNQSTEITGGTISGNPLSRKNVSFLNSFGVGSRIIYSGRYYSCVISIFLGTMCGLVYIALHPLKKNTLIKHELFLKKACLGG